MARAAAKLLVATETFSTDVDGHEVIVHAGVTRVRAGHPVVKGREHLFVPEPDEVDVPEPSGT